MSVEGQSLDREILDALADIAILDNELGFILKAAKLLALDAASAGLGSRDALVRIDKRTRILGIVAARAREKADKAWMCAELLDIKLELAGQKKAKRGAK